MNLAHLPPRQKRPPLASPALRASARGQDCALRLPCCNHNPETTGKFVQTPARQAMRDITNEHDNFTPAWWVPIFAILGAAIWALLIVEVMG